MKIAFLFLTIDDVNFPEIWEYYFKNNNDKFNIYCHPKNPQNVKTSWLKKNIIKNLTTTKWGHFTNAVINLLKSALINKDNEKFMIVSESCLPIKSFESFYSMLKSDDIKTSYINISKNDNIINIKHSKIDDSYLSNINIIKHSGWFCLSRHHVKRLLINSNIYKFNKIIAGDENILSLIYPSNNIINFQITYDNWDYNINKINILNEKLKKLYELKEEEKTKKYDNQILNIRIQKSTIGKHPKIYEIISKKELDEIKDLDSFFMRKFSKESDIFKHFKKLI